MKYRIAHFFMFAFLIFSFISCTSTRLTRPLFKVSFSGNITTGFQWFFREESEGNIELVDVKYTQNSATSKQVGQGGEFTFTFRARNRGDFVLNFDYYRPWDKKNIEKTESIRINVNDKYVITRV